MGKLKLIRGKVLGRGQPGTVTYLCTDKASNEMVARKSISKEALMTGVQDLGDVLQEIAIMKQLPKHPNIVSYKGSYEDDNSLHLVMELCDGGELFDHIVAIRHFSERRAASLTRSIMDMVQTLHKHGIMHRDLKPANLLFTNKNVNSPLKVIDFGLAVFFTPGEKFSDIAGTPEYMAPEMLNREYGPEVDMWSAGVILYMMLSGLRPFWTEMEEGARQEIVGGALDLESNPWPRVSDSAKSLVRHMLEPDPKTRYIAQQVLDHPWLQNAE